MFSGDDLSIEGDGSVGEMLADKLGAKLAEQEQNNGCFIRSLSVSGSTATVGFETVKDCTVIVGVYTEECAHNHFKYASILLCQGISGGHICTVASLQSLRFAGIYTGHAAVAQIHDIRL